MPPVCTDADQDGYYAEGGQCGQTDCNDNNAAINPGATEICNGVDDNCNGSTDEGVQSIFYQDADGDAYGNALITIEACSAPSGYVSDSTDCNDDNNAINPGATEVCNGVDDNCNQGIDEGGVCSTNSYYCDSDLDTYTSATPTGTCDTFECVPSECTTTQGDDCNDSNSAINPGATEICGNQVDEDCNGSDAQCLSVLINAYKLVCQAETDLPNWGTSGAQKPSVITENTASEYVTSSGGKCQIASGWDFQWGFDGTSNQPYQKSNWFWRNRME